MNDEANTMVFRSKRPEDHEPVSPAPLQLGAQAGAMVAEPKPAPEPHAGVSILVISNTADLGEMIGTALGADANTKVDYSKNALAELKDEDLSFLLNYNIVVFEATPGNSVEMLALRRLAAARPPETKFLAMTAGDLTLAYAKELMDVGVDEVLPMSAIRPDLKSAVPSGARGEATEPKRDAEDRNGAIIAIAQTRGGIGSTSAALAMAHQLIGGKKATRKTEAVPPKKVVVVDLDIQNGNAGAYVDAEDNGRVIGMLKTGQLAKADDVQAMIVPYSSNLHILPAPTEFAPLDALKPEMVATLLDELRYAYDYVILDLPRVIIDWMEPVLARTDQMLIMTDTAVPSVRQARRLIDFFTDDHVSLPIEIVIGQERKRFSLTEAQKEASAILERDFEHWLPRDESAALKAADTGQPVTEIAAKSHLSKAIIGLAEAMEKTHSGGIRRRA